MVGDDVVDLAGAAELLQPDASPADTGGFTTMVDFFAAGQDGRRQAEDLLGAVEKARVAGRALVLPDGRSVVQPVDDVRILAPIPRPRRMRDYFTYRQHADGGGLAVPPAFEAMPICYQCNVDSVIGPDDVVPWPPYTDQLDYELEIGFFVGPGGRNIRVEQADSHIAGVTLFNDVSARDIQMFEMGMTIGPSKGKDFCNVLGPVVATLDEIDEGSIELTARINGEVWSHGTTADRQFSFAEVLAWASYGEDVHTGEFLAIGTVGGGCGAELDRWLRPGDVVELEASGIGVLRNPIGHPEIPAPGAGLRSYRGAPRFTLPSS
ncbi:fumarylacetoacetate hydrolase family protein [Rhodococcus opacus]|uniref:Fumarylacetoacetate hydrolase family protein n=1 Tax=Rhodococcus opacus TaxID=37919 RepID=A0AAX3YPD5_RHOOP|nr:fumarylacetoacetate hydrolase family protein [Rhodococcus opacus]WLF51387.1 fumarylacetoacetate hydrolase family protein [Rhodococcus opacus]